MYRNIIIKFCLYALLLLGIHGVAAWSAGAYFDPFYLRFTTGKHASMILGTSRAAQGILPAEMNAILGADYSPIGNFSFTVANSPYGEVYLDAIRQKLDTTPNAKPNIFILAVDAWSISTINNVADNPEKFRENDLFLDKMTSIGKAGKPNWEYLTQAYSESWGKILYRPITTKRRMRLHEDGWLEVTVPMDSMSIRKRTNQKTLAYRGFLNDYTLSINRLRALEKTISYLQKHGRVVLVRLPVGASIQQIEDELMPDFDEKMYALTQQFDVSYWSYAPQSADYIYTDGNHLYKDSGRKISRIIAERILKE